MRIGIDVGGTNTDAVLMDGATVLAAIKSPTTEDIASGVINAIRHLIQSGNVAAADITAVMIGTTQFTNAFLERKRLTPVGVIRLGLPATTSVYPMVDWDAELKAVVGLNHFLVHGGCEFDGRAHMPLNEMEVANAARALKAKSVRAVAISSIFAPIDNSQELRAAEIVRNEIGDAAITLSSEIGRLGLIERENATIVNASLSQLAGHVVSAFRRALIELKIDAPFYISQNDGTLMSADYVERFPVLTFASGPTNSMRGAAYLTHHKEALVVDIGGTTSDVGVLSQGFPRESAVSAVIGGVTTNFRMPDVTSIALGGGSRVRHFDDPARLVIGPDSVGYRLPQEALVFGGSTLTTTDIVVAAGRADLGDRNLVKHLSSAGVEAAEDRIHAMLEDVIDRMKTSQSDVPVILVGGGAVLVSRDLKGASDVIIPTNSGVANAIGAAMAQVGGEIDKVYSYDQLGRDKAISLAIEEARSRCVAAGGDESALTVLDLEELPLTYLPGGSVRLRVKVVGDLRPDSLGSSAKQARNA
jgi:N-methylhydantoinase A/oxoprolinase/acetone carboxylase beta subunit